jgi:ferritin-like metal-binding protein YciE
MASINSLQDLFIEELQILLSGEQQLIEALPKMAQAASSPELRAGFEKHLEQTKDHARRLQDILKDLGAAAEPKTCAAMQGLIKAGETRVKLDAPGEIRDVALIIAGQRVEHFEIAGYGSARTFAQLLGRDDVAELLETTEEEEAETDKELTRIAESLNAEALSHAG